MNGCSDVILQLQRAQCPDFAQCQWSKAQKRKFIDPYITFSIARASLIISDIFD